ncbi:MAG: hypothetical protein WCG80_15595 [Spirochaetales bacterium]
MTLAARTLNSVLDTFQKKEGIWKSTARVSYSQLYKSLESSTVCFAEWDPERGLYYLDFSGLEDDAVTIDLLMLDFSGVQGNDHYRFELTAGGRLGGVELQTHVAGPLPFLPEIGEWIEPDYENRSPPLTLEAWQSYLAQLVPMTPPL